MKLTLWNHKTLQTQNIPGLSQISIIVYSSSRASWGREFQWGKNLAYKVDRTHAGATSQCNSQATFWCAQTFRVVVLWLILFHGGGWLRDVMLCGELILH